MKLFLGNNILMDGKSIYVVVLAESLDEAMELCASKFAPNDTSEWCFGFRDGGNYTELEQDGESAVVSWLSIKEHFGVDE